MMEIQSLVLFSLSIGFAACAPYLGGPVYQSVVEPYVYLDPNTLQYQSVPYNQVYSVPSHQHVFTPALTSHQVFELASQHQKNTPLPHEEVAEINQFHSEDGQGRVLYGFHGHNQARMEARDAQGRVRGSYSYIDPNGHLVRMDYWDDGSGFQARGSNIPKAAYDVPTFTPEVQAAREEHFKLYQQILLSNIHAQPPNKLPEDDYPYVERPDGAITSPTHQVDEDDTVEVGVYPNQPNDLPSYSESFPETYPGSMRLPGQFLQPAFPFQDDDDDELDSIALDNPEFQDLGRSGKSLAKESNQENSDKDDTTKPMEEIKDKKEQETKKEVKKDEKKPENEKTEVAEKKTILEKTDESKKEEMSNEKHEGFSYHIQYTLGTPAKIQNAPNFHKITSIAASEPITEKKTTSVHSVHPLPLHTMTGLFRTNPSAVHDSQLAPHQVVDHSQFMPTLVKSGLTQMSAIHDPQVPQRNIGNDHMKTEKHN